MNAAHTGAGMVATTVTNGVRGNTWCQRRLALLAGTMLALHWTAPAIAQSVSPAETSQQSISIPAGPLTQALNRLAAQAGLQILFDASLTQGKTTQGVSGTLTPAQALNALLAGTGLRAQFAGRNQVTLTLNPPPASAAGAVPDGAIALNTITIYGARDATTLDGTSASVGIVTAKDIEYGQIRNVRESFRRLANVTDNAFVDSGFSIRGMSSEGFVPSASLMGSLYVDGVLQTMNAMRRGARSLWDVEQVEVYRGPQSTLSGRAATIGAIYIKTKDPTFKKEAEISGTTGNNNLLGTNFMVNTPVLDNQVAIRISGGYERSKDEIKYPNYAHYNRYGDLTTGLNYFVRAKALIAPSEMPDTKALLSYSFTRDSPLLREIFTGTGIAFDDDRGDLYRFPAWSEVRTTKVHNLGLEVTHNFSDALRFTSLTGYHRSHNTRPSVNQGTPGEASVTSGDQYDTLLTQELRLNYEAGRWKWVGGLFGSYQTYDTFVDTTVEPIRSYGEKLDRRTNNLAAFGEATYEFIPTWKFTFGGRVDYTKASTGIRSWIQPWGGAYSETTYPAEFEEVNLVPKVGLSKDLAVGHTAGVTYSEGFRTGGYYINYRTYQPAYYDPEMAQNYELFYKGRFLNDRLRLNANLFFTRYSDQQIEIRPDINDPLYRETSNAASSRSWGFEIEPSWQVTDRFSVFASIGYLNTEFIEFNHASYGDLSGQPFPEAPNWTVAFGGRYEFENGFYIGGDAKYTSSYLARFGIPPQDEVGSRFIANMQTGYRRDNWELNLFAENLFDVRYYTVTDRQATPAFAQVAPRRSIGVNLKAKF